MEHHDLVGELLKSPGVEIGAFTTPIPGIHPFYVDRFGEYADQPTLAEYYGDSADLPFLDSSLEYVASSHVIEHVANPLAAFLEWFRVLRDGAIIYMVVPDRRLTFDRGRALTRVDHMIDDYRSGVTQCDATHIRDFVFNVDWNEFSPNTPSERVMEERKSLLTQYERSIEVGTEINIHFHTFQPENMIELIERCNDVLPLRGGRIEMLRREAPFPASLPNGFLIIARVYKPGTMPAFGRPSDILRPNARKFDRTMLAARSADEWNEENFPEKAYLELNPDVADAVHSGQFRSGLSHYRLFGYREERQIGPKQK